MHTIVTYPGLAYSLLISFISLISDSKFYSVRVFIKGSNLAKHKQFVCTYYMVHFPTFLPGKNMAIFSRQYGSNDASFACIGAIFHL